MLSYSLLRIKSSGSPFAVFQTKTAVEIVAGDEGCGCAGACTAIALKILYINENSQRLSNL